MCQCEPTMYPEQTICEPTECQSEPTICEPTMCGDPACEPTMFPEPTMCGDPECEPTIFPEPTFCPPDDCLNGLMGGTRRMRRERICPAIDVPCPMDGAGA